MKNKNIKINQIILCLSVLLIFAACKDKELTDYPINFNKGWKFYSGDDSLAFSPDYIDTAWRMLNLPHDWSIAGDFSEDHPTKPGGGALPAGIGWYRKSFNLPETDKGKNIFIDFDGIYRNSEVWINGHYLGKKANGYISFRYDLTPWLNFGEKTNIIAVKADNSLQPNSRWYTGSGIYRNVWLVKKNGIYIDHWGINIATPEVSENKALIDIRTKIGGKANNAEKIEIQTTIFDQNDKKLSNNSETVFIKSSLPVFKQVIDISNPALWSPESPSLYKAKIEIFTDDKKSDEETIQFGVRYFHFDADSGFFLNGKRYEIRGVNLHHDKGAIGAAVNIRAIERQLEIMKGMGVNAIRTAHNPPSPEFLNLCDNMGFLVMDEAFDVWKLKKVKYDYNIDWEENHKQDLKDLILRDRNHPSVFMWSIGNEIREQFDSTGLIIAKELADIVKSIDTTRPVTSALTETVPEKNFIYQSGALDVLSFNYKHKDWAKFKENFPGQKMIAAENMSAYATRGHYDMPSDSVRYWPEKFGEPIIGGNPDYTVSAYDMVCAYWGATHEETLKALYSYSFIGGMFIWSGCDFIGEPVPYEWPAKSSYYGVVDLAGFPKDVYYLYQSIWTDTPTLHLFPHWNWEEGKTIDVWAYYNQADEVELFINGESQGIRKKKDNEFHVQWRVKYQPGEIKAVSRKNGQQFMEKTIKTAGKPAKIELIADRPTIKANGTDLCFVTVKITDNEGNMVPDANNLVNFKIAGNGFIAGVDNGYQASHESFKDNKRKAFNGMCLAIIQSTEKAGEITLEASSEGLKNQTLKITAQ